jgi:hypothetical protein
MGQTGEAKTVLGWDAKELQLQNAAEALMMRPVGVLQSVVDEIRLF